MKLFFFLLLLFLQNLRNEEQVAIIQASTVLSLAEKVRLGLTTWSCDVRIKDSALLM